MNPLEELQAAHKRLSALRTDGPPWTARHEDAEVLAGPYFVASTAADQYTDLIVILHRTIDAQLDLLRDAIDFCREFESNDAVEAVSAQQLALARAINGEAS